MLQAAHISDDEYFSHMVLDDLNLIIRDIREAHKKDSESAPQTTVADELKENLEAVENFKGSRDEKLVVLYCKQLGINYKNLSDEEFRWLIRILKKSKKMGTPISQRKNGKEKPLLHGWDAFHVAAVLTVVIISFVFLISGDNLFLPLVRPV